MTHCRHAGGGAPDPGRRTTMTQQVQRLQFQEAFVALAALL